MISIFKKKQKEDKNFSTFGIHSTLDQTKIPQMQKQNAINENKGWVYAITNMVANNVAQSQLNLYVKTNEDQKPVKNFKTFKLSELEAKGLDFDVREGNIERIYYHPAEQLLKTVNSYTDGFNLLYETCLYLDITGDAYWYCIEDQYGTPQELHLLNSLNMKIIPNETNDAVQYYEYKVKNGSEVFKPHEIIHFRTPNLASKWYGVPPILNICGNIALLKQSEYLEYSTLKNFGMPSLLFKYTGSSNLTKNERNNFERQWQKTTTGNKLNRVKVIDGNFEVEKLAQSLEEMMLTENKVINIKAICAAYGVPYTMLDSTEQKKAGLDQLLDIMALNCVQPRLTRIQEVLNQQLLPKFDESGDLVFKYSDPSPEAPEKEAQVLTQYVGAGIITINEARRVLGLGEMKESDIKKPEKPEKDNTKKGAENEKAN